MSKLTLTARRIDDAGKQRTQCAVVPVFEKARLSGAARSLDKASGGVIGNVMALGDFSGKRGQTQMLPGPGPVQRILLVGCGDRDKFDRKGQLEFVGNLGRALKGTQATDAVLYLDGLPTRTKELRWLLPTLARGLVTARYSYSETLSKPADPARLSRMVVDSGKGLSTGEAGRLLKQGALIGDGVNAARELANLPGNVCTPDYLAKEARKLGRKYKGLATKVLDEKKMRELGMGSLLSVGRATKPGDVVTSMSGKTIEILNTDAEGRLVLCDALTYAERYKPAAVVDIATLTGACVVALGSHASGLYANKDSLAEELISAGEESHDRAWRMPLWDDYQDQLKSNFADVANIGGPGGGSITAACFLSRFAQKYDWAHLDIAGSAWDSAPKGATGRPVALLTRYLQDRAG